ncbi:MAG TPA: hypothetical protein VJV75_04545 [Candidatus Polarisedimenticolia bacterium]|nr:hypothetical protein [Candidatus Polarisedimenticolia bacterium]
MSEREAARTTTAPADPEDRQLPLAAPPTAIERIERDETEVEEILKKSTQDSLLRLPNVSLAEVKRVLEARAELIKTIREIAIKQTAPEDWTLYKARDGSVLGVPTAAACLKIRRWAGVSIFNHRGLDGAEMPALREAKNTKGENILIIEGLADGQSGRDLMPGIYFSIRSDDDFVGRATVANNPRRGGPRQEDLMSCWRTGIDAKVVRAMTGTTKVSAVELVALGIDVARCVKGSGFGNAQERAAGSVAEGGVKEAAQALWKDILRSVNGKVEDAKSVLREITSYPSFKGSDGNQVKAFAGIDSPDAFTKMEKVKKAADKFQKHAAYVPPPAEGDGAGEGA